MWGWFGVIGDWFKSLWETIKGIPNLVFNAFVDALNNIGGKIKDVWQAVTDLPSLILEGIKAVFIPDTEELKADVLGLVDSVSHTFNLGIDSKDWLVDSFSEQAVSDVESDYKIHGVGTFHLTFLDVTYLKRGVEYFRPIIRGFIVLLLMFFNYKQVLTFIGQDPAMYNTARNNAKGED